MYLRVFKQLHREQEVHLITSIPKVIPKFSFSFSCSKQALLHTFKIILIRVIQKKNLRNQVNETSNFQVQYFLKLQTAIYLVREKKITSAFDWLLNLFSSLNPTLSLHMKTHSLSISFWWVDWLDNRATYINQE